jgi:hypothetical protein
METPVKRSERLLWTSAALSLAATVREPTSLVGIGWVALMAVLAAFYLRRRAGQVAGWRDAALGAVAVHAASSLLGLPAWSALAVMGLYVAIVALTVALRSLEPPVRAAAVR